MHQVLGQQLYPIKSNEHKISHWSLYNNSTKQEYPTLIYIWIIPSKSQQETQY